MDGDIVPRFHAQPPPSFRRTPLGGLKSLSSQCRHRTRRLTPRHGHVDWSESDSSWRALSRDSSADWVLTFFLGWIGFAIMINASLIVRIGIGLILGQFLMIPFLP